MTDADITPRMLSLDTALGRNVLHPTSFQLEEMLSATYNLLVHAVSLESSIDPDAILFQPAHLSIQCATSDPRIVHGIVRTFAATGEPQRGRFAYTLTIVPQIWFMDQTRDCRIFTKKSAVDIISTLCRDCGQKTEFRVAHEQTLLPYVTQYNESDLSFFSRMVEEAGFFYFFEHSPREHVLVLGDRNQNFPQTPKPTLRVVHAGGGMDVLTHWRKVGRTAYGSHHLRDYDSLKPNTLPESKQPSTLATPGVKVRDVFEWPALGLTEEEVKRRARLKQEAAEAQALLVEAHGEEHRFLPGARFVVSPDPFGGSDNPEYIIRSLSCTGHDHSWLAGQGSSAYSNRIVAFQAATPWRETFVTPRPVMTGVHSAVVIGSEDEEIHADEYGRVKVRFFWDHREDATADTACWVRVVQSWAGKGWGAQFIPRVGTEVAVAFVDGDPDRPIVVGGLYNGRDTPIYSKANTTKSGFRTRSTLKGGTSDFNELTFEDKKGNELIYQQAQKDLKTYVKNDQTLTIDNCRIVTVKKDETVDIQNNQTIKVKQDHSLTVTDGNRAILVSKGNNSLTVDMGNHTTDVKMGDVHLKADLGAISNEAMQSIELKVGQNSIKIDQMGVTIKGMMISIEGQLQSQLKGLMTQVNADAMLLIKGAITMIN